MSDSFMDEYAEAPPSNLDGLRTLGKSMHALFEKYKTAEETYVQARQEYEHFAHTLMPQYMQSLGIEAVDLADGGKVRLVRNYYCKPNKNDKDKQVMYDWLRNNGGDYLIKPEAKTTNIEALKAAHIPYTECGDVNTSSLKAFIKDLLGVSSGYKKIDLEDIPPCLHFNEVTTAEFVD